MRADLSRSRKASRICGMLLLLGLLPGACSEEDPAAPEPERYYTVVALNPGRAGGA